MAELFVQWNCNLMVPGASHLTCYPPDSLPLPPSLTPLLSIVNIQQIGLLLTGHFARSMLFFFSLVLCPYNNFYHYTFVKGKKEEDTI